MELNALGMKCPMPIVRLGRAIREVPVGGMITVMADDGPFPSDLRALAQEGRGTRWCPWMRAIPGAASPWSGKKVNKQHCQ